MSDRGQFRHRPRAKAVHVWTSVDEQQEGFWTRLLGCTCVIEKVHEQQDYGHRLVAAHVWMRM
jgi:hypothetical protein